MKVKVLKKSNNSLVFEMKDTSPVFANTLRRLILGRVKSLAVEDVEIIKNTSAIYDEVLAHRLGLLPIAYKPETLNVRDECKCKGKGCSKCQVKMVLKKNGPATVYSGDIKSTSKTIKPLDDKIIITKLLENQAIELEMTMELGQGREHAKWSPAVVGYHYAAKVKVNGKCPNKTEVAKACPKGLLSKDLKLTDSGSCDLCGACEDACENESLKLVPDESKIIFNIESTSGISAKEIVLESLKEIKNMLDLAGKELKIKLK